MCLPAACAKDFRVFPTIIHTSVSRHTCCSFFFFMMRSCFVRLEGLFLHVFYFSLCVFLFFVLFISNVSGGRWGARAFSVQNGHTLCAFLYFFPLLKLKVFVLFFVFAKKSGRALVTHAHPDEIGFRSTCPRLRDVSIFPPFFQIFKPLVNFLRNIFLLFFLFITLIGSLL